MLIKRGVIAFFLLAPVSGAFAENARTALEPQQPAPLPVHPNSPGDTGTLLHPDQLQTLVEIEATVVSVQAGQHQLTVQDMKGRGQLLLTDANTRILDPQNHAYSLAELKPKDRLRIYEDRKSRLASQIDLLPSVGDVILGK